MFNRKLVFSTAALSFGAWKFFSIEYPKNYESPNAFRMQQLFINSFTSYGEYSEYFGLGSYVNIVRIGIEKMIPPSPVNLSIKKLNTTINGVRARIYTPVTLNNTSNSPIIIYYHGGGYSLGSLEQYDEYITELCLKTNGVVISVDYKLAPENPFPKPTEECYTLTKYVLESKNEFGNTNKVILAGDSAGGNCVAVMTQRLKVEKVKQPILQVLIYPWTQLLTLRTASGIHYTKHNPPGVFAKLVCWYLGITDPKDISAAMELFETNSHIELLTDSKEREKIKLYCDSNLIPAEYRKEYYYNNYNIDKQFITNKVSNALLNDEKIKEAFKKLISPEISPGFADSEKLIGLPKAYFILSGFDILKDDGLLYAERLRKAGVDVKIKYYENSFHGISQIINKKVGPQVARDMLDDLVVEIKKYLSFLKIKLKNIYLFKNIILFI